MQQALQEVEFPGAAAAILIREKAGEDLRPLGSWRGTRGRGWGKPVQNSRQQQRAPPARRQNLSAPGKRLQAPGPEPPAAAPAATRRLPRAPPLTFGRGDQVFPILEQLLDKLIGLLQLGLVGSHPLPEPGAVQVAVAELEGLQPHGCRCAGARLPANLSRLRRSSDLLGSRGAAGVPAAVRRQPRPQRQRRSGGSPRAGLDAGGGEASGAEPPSPLPGAARHSPARQGGRSLPPTPPGRALPSGAACRAGARLPPAPRRRYTRLGAGGLPPAPGVPVRGRRAGAPLPAAGSPRRKSPLARGPGRARCHAGRGKPAPQTRRLVAAGRGLPAPVCRAGRPPGLSGRRGEGSPRGNVRGLSEGAAQHAGCPIPNRRWWRCLRCGSAGGEGGAGAARLSASRSVPGGGTVPAAAAGGALRPRSANGDKAGEGARGTAARAALEEAAQR